MARKLPPPLFLLAPPRSFTSVINAMIGQHPQAYGVPELNIFTARKLRHLWQPEIKDFIFDSKLRHGLLRTVAEIYTGEQTDETINFAEHWCSIRQDHLVGDVFDEIREKIYPLFPVDKSPFYTVNKAWLDSIIENCPDARFIHLVRHPIKQCDSTMTLSNGMFPRAVNSVEYQKDKVIIEPQVQWHDLNVNILNFLENKVPKEQWITIRGEDVMEFPEVKLKEICNWLDIRDDDAAIASMMRSEESPYACFGPITALFGNDPNFLRRPKFKQHKPNTPTLTSKLPWREDGKGLYPEVIELAQEFGYL